jgi:sn-glycerol 3-phosphate transport system substrate-binding protein
MRNKADDENKAAYEFVKYMASKDIQRQWHTRMGYFPIRQDVINDLEKEGYYKKYPAARTAIDQLLSSADNPASQGALMGVFPEVRGYIESAVEEVLSGKATVEVALKRAEEKTNQALERYQKIAKQ